MKQRAHVWYYFIGSQHAYCVAKTSKKSDRFPGRNKCFHNGIIQLMFKSRTHYKKNPTESMQGKVCLLAISSAYSLVVNCISLCITAKI